MCEEAFPSFIHVSHGRLHDVNVLDLLLTEPGAFYLMDRAYLDFDRLYTPAPGGEFLCHQSQVQHSIPNDCIPGPLTAATGVICDQDWGVHRLLFTQRLSRTLAPHPL